MGLNLGFAAFIGATLIIMLGAASRPATWAKFKADRLMMGFLIGMSATMLIAFSVELAFGIGAMR